MNAKTLCVCGRGASRLHHDAPRRDEKSFEISNTMETRDISIGKGAESIHIWGNQGVQGVYLLELELSQTLTLAFGRFQRGQHFILPAGAYLYVGSALGQRGATTLAGRLLRHATRTMKQPPHLIRPALQTALQQVGIEVRLPQQKRCHWHVDYLLDQPAAHLTQIYALRTAQGLEATIALHLQADPATRLVAAGLGASDHPHATHLFQLDLPAAAQAAWRQTLVDKLQRLLVSSKG